MPPARRFDFTIGAHALTIVGALLFVAFPVLFVAGSTWGARAVVSDLLRQNAALQVENADYRDATAHLAAGLVRPAGGGRHVEGRRRSQSAGGPGDAAAARLHYPSAMGGGVLSGVTAPLADAMGSADPVFSLVGDVLRIIEAQLDRVRPGAERRQALAAAAP